VLLLIAVLLLGATAAAQELECSTVKVFEPCDFVFELQPGELAQHPAPFRTVDIRAEFNTPHHRTMLLRAFWDGGGRFVLRFTATEPGTWRYRITGNVARLSNREGAVEAREGEHAGFIRPANVHHWQYTGSLQPHLWMGDTAYRFAVLSIADFRRLVDLRAEQKFNHIRGHVHGTEENAEKVWRDPDRPDTAFFRGLDERIRYMNSKGVIADLILGHDRNHLRRLFSNREQRERYVRYLIARYAPFNITWQLVQEYEGYENARELMKELGLLLKEADPYQHPRSTHTEATSSPLLGDGWMTHVLYQSSDDQLGAIERQLYAVPFVNAEFACEDSGAGRSHAHHVDSDTFRRRLWNATMNGQYPTFGNTGTYGGAKMAQDLKYLQSVGAQQMKIWHEFFARTRYWELEPYFDLDGGRALALPGVEYIVYIEKPAGPVEIRMEKHGYDVAWFNPRTGERTLLKDIKTDRFAIEPPDQTHDWVLHISREGRKESMLRSYKFESRRIFMQEIESTPAKLPFDIAEPAGEEIRPAAPVRYEVRLRRQTRGTRWMMYLWMGEMAGGKEGARVLGTGSAGTLRIPEVFRKEPSAVLNLRLYGMNANGKVYMTDRVYRLVQ
jgi:hypothetical protein